MIKDKQRKTEKLVIVPSDIDYNNFSLPTNENLQCCLDCNSNLHYIVLKYGVVVEEYDYGVMHNRSNRIYTLRPVGIDIFCAECGCFNEFYTKWFYPEDKLVILFDELVEIDAVEKAEVEHCLNQYDQKGNFQPLYKCSCLSELKKKLDEYEKKHPVKVEKKNVEKKNVEKKKVKKNKQ